MERSYRAIMNAEIKEAPAKHSSSAGVRFNSVTKRFPGIVANDAISFEIRRGAVHALLGENGAGKTTLMNILAGINQPDSGHISLDGSSVEFQGPGDARRSGIGMVHQHCSVLPALTVAENILLEEQDGGFFVKRRSYGDTLKKEAETYDMKIDVDQPVWQLSYGQRQWLEVFRLLHFGSAILILDEPTSMLSPVEGDKLLERLRTMAKARRTIILVTHKIKEIMRFADYVTVLRKGRAIKTLLVKSTTSDELSSLVVGDAPGFGTGRRKGSVVGAANRKTSVLEVKNLNCMGKRGSPVLIDLSFTIQRYTVVGVAGVCGNGQEELAGVTAGLENPSSGEIRLYTAQNALIEDRRSFTRYIAADRLGLAAVGDLSVGENLVLRDFSKRPIAKNGFLNRKMLERVAQRRARLFGVQTVNLQQPLSSLSGGNIQRVILARELSGEFDLLVAHNPTAGLDIQGVSFVHKRIVDVAEAGKGVLLISEDLDELTKLSDELIVLHQGKSMGTFDVEDITRAQIGLLMMGHDSKGHP